MKKIIYKIIKRIHFYGIYIKANILRTKYNNKLLPNSLKIKGNELSYHFFRNKYYKYLKNSKRYEHTHEHSNYVWWCWLQGEENAPDLNKACLQSLRENLHDRKIVVITKDNLKEYTDIPDYILEKYKKGYISNTHFSDILRTELLVKNGGTWIDSSVLCTSYNKNFFDKDLFFYKNMMKDESIVCSSWFITAEKQNPVLMTTRDLLHMYWKKYNYLAHYYLFHTLFTLSFEIYKDELKNVKTYSNVPPHVLQFELLDKYDEDRFNDIENMSSFHKLSQKIDFSKCDGKTNYDYVIKKYLSKGDKNE